MNRKDIINFVNNDILSQIDSGITWHDMFVSGRELIKLVSDYRSRQIEAGKARIDDKYTAKVIDGYLYINNEPIARIAPKTPKISFDEYSYYIEGRILARQEAYYND